MNMIPTDNKQTLIDDFCSFVENIPDTEFDNVVDENTVDLFTLCQELTMLKSLVKQESRQFKSALDSFKAVFNALQQSHNVLTKELSDKRQEQLMATERQQHILLKPLLLYLIELRDRLESSISCSNVCHFPFWVRYFFKKQQHFLTSIYDGQMMLLRRIDNMLSNYEVKSFETVNHLFDPEFMQAVAVESHPLLSNGIVLEELHKGFIWKNEILRIAIVKVNKITK